MKRALRIAEYVAVAWLLYFVVAMNVYRFRHPELTETQLFLRMPDAIRFRR